jgi:hypothetical protein
MLKKNKKFKQTKTSKGCKIDNKKQFWIGMWSMSNYNLEWLWNCHNDNHQNTHPT